MGDGMVEGGAALGMGIYRGFTGLVTKPVEGAKSKGVGGTQSHAGGTVSSPSRYDVPTHLLLLVSCSLLVCSSIC